MIRSKESSLFQCLISITLKRPAFFFLSSIINKILIQFKKLAFSLYEFFNSPLSTKQFEIYQQWQQSQLWNSLKDGKNPDGINLFKINFGNMTTMHKICLKVSLETPEWRHWQRSGVFINFEKISFAVFMFPLLPLNK